MSEEISTVSKHEIKVGINRIYDYVGEGDFDIGETEWNILKQNIIKFYGSKGRGHEIFNECFEDGDWILSRVIIDENKKRMYDVLLKIAQLLKGGGEAYQEGKREGIFARTKDIYTDLLENYRVFSIKNPTNEKMRLECIALANIMGDALMELRDMEKDYDNLGDHKLYAKYNAVRRQIGKCESVLPRIIDAFRSSQVKNNIQKEFSILFERLEDLLSPVQEVNLKDYEDRIVQLLGEGKTLDEIASAINIPVNTLAIYIQDNMKTEDFAK